MKMQKFSVGLLLMCGLVGGVVSGPTAKGLTLTEAFRSCSFNMLQQPLVNDLLTVVVDRSTQERFKTAHSTEARNLFVGPKEESGFAEAKVELINAAAIAGVVPRSLSAFTCPEGCDTLIGVLGFGRLGRAEQAKLRAWVARAPTYTMDNHRKVKVKLTTGPSEEVFLICDEGL